MTVQELINELEKLPNKNKKVFVYQPPNVDPFIMESRAVLDDWVSNTLAYGKIEFVLIR